MCWSSDFGTHVCIVVLAGNLDGVGGVLVRADAQPGPPPPPHHPPPLPLLHRIVSLRHGSALHDAILTGMGRRGWPDGYGNAVNAVTNAVVEGQNRPVQ